MPQTKVCPRHKFPDKPKRRCKKKCGLNGGVPWTRACLGQGEGCTLLSLTGQTRHRRQGGIKNHHNTSSTRGYIKGDIINGKAWFLMQNVSARKKRCHGQEGGVECTLSTGGGVKDKGGSRLIFTTLGGGFCLDKAGSRPGCLPSNYGRWRSLI